MIKNSSSIQINQIHKNIQEAIIGSDPIKDFCQDNFNKGLVLLIHMDEQNLPTQCEAPFILIERVGHDGGTVANAQTFIFSITAGIDADSLPIETNIISGVEVVEITAGGKLDDLLYLIVDELENNIDPALSINNFEIDWDDLISYPLIVATINFTITIQRVIGAQRTIGGH